MDNKSGISHLVLLIAILSSTLLTGCGKDSVSPDPDDGQDALLVNGLAATVPQESNSEFAALAVHKDGQMLAVLQDPQEETISGVVFRTSDGHSLTVFTGNDGLPDRAVSHNADTRTHIFVYNNWTPSSVDIAVIDNNGNIFLERTIEIDASELFRRGADLNADASISTANAIRPTASLSDLSVTETLQYGALVLKAAACAKAIYVTAGFGALVLPCGSTIAAVLLALGPSDDERLNESGEAFTAAADLLGCQIDFTLAHCVATISDLVRIGVNLARDALEHFDNEIATAKLNLGAIYVSSAVSTVLFGTIGPSHLYLVEVSDTGIDRRIGRIETPSGEEPVITDIDADPQDRLWGISQEKLYRIDRTSASAEEVGSTGLSNLVALEWVDESHLYAANSDGAFLTIDPQTAEAEIIGEFGDEWQSSGDLEIGPDGILYATVRNGSDGDVLVEIDRDSGRATPVDAGTHLGFPYVFGLSSLGGKLLGLTTNLGSSGTGFLIEIDPNTGTANAVRTLEFQASGSASRR